MDIKSIIRDYKKRKLCRALAELDDFRTLPTFGQCINNAALAIHQNDKRYRHQFRISKKTLSVARDILLAHKKSIRKTRNFDELFVIIDDLLKSVKGIGELYIYDTSLRPCLGNRISVELASSRIERACRCARRWFQPSIKGGSCVIKNRWHSACLYKRNTFVTL